MPTYLDREREKPGRGRQNLVRVALINNMPDSAAEATERQFIELLDRAASGVDVSISLYTLRNRRRPGSGRECTLDRYLPVENLLEQSVDGLIVTGAEPKAEQLTMEPYWQSLTRVIDWARRETLSTVWSCLAAHAAVLHLDGISRHLLASKRFGVFEFSSAYRHPMMNGVPQTVHIPHSRWNDLKAEDLAASGYEILTSAAHGVDAFVKQDKNLFVFFQGHPEYDSDTLLREYRRDLGRFLRKERDKCPSLPQGYFDRGVVAELKDLRERCVADRRRGFMSDIPAGNAFEKEIANSWQPVAVRLYRNWLGYLCAAKTRRSTFRMAKTRSLDHLKLELS